MPKYVSDLLKDYRRKRGIDQYKMARDLDISRQTISRYENGRYERIPISSAFIIVDYLNINIEYTFNAFVLDGLNKYHFNLLKNEVINRNLNISDDFFDLYSSQQTIQKLNMLKTPCIPTKELIDTLKLPLEIDDVNQKESFEQVVNIGSIIKSFIEKRDIPITTLSKETGINRATIYKYINNEIQITFTNLTKIINTLDIPPVLLFDMSTSTFKYDNHSPSHDELVSYCINSLNPSEAKRAYSILKVIFDSDEATH